MAKNRGTGINHLNLVRVRVEGEGPLNIKAWSYSVASSHDFTTITMEIDPSKIPTSKGNFRKMRMQLELSTDTIDDWFKIGQIFAYVAPSGSSYPNG